MLPPSLTDLTPITGIDPFDGLPITADIWKNAHEYHGNHHRLHLRGSHRPGIVSGLDVKLSGEKQNFVTISPGVAIDARGQVLLVPKEVSLELRGTRRVYILLRFQPLTDKNAVLGTQYYRIVDGKEVASTTSLPNTPYIELARIYRTAENAAAQEAGNPFEPGNNEINLLHRPRTFPYCFADGGAGELNYNPADSKARTTPNRAGLALLCRTAATQGLHVDFAATVNVVETERKDLLLLYMAGDGGFDAFDDEDISGLRNLLAGGMVLLGESVGGNAAWRNSFMELTKALGAKMQPMNAYTPLLTSHHVFGTPPPGAHRGSDLVGDPQLGVLYSDSNWGGMWQGQAESGAAAREDIRAAQEWGMNIMVWASDRRRQIALTDAD